MKIWIRVGMEADITVEELENLRKGDEEAMKKIIQRADIGGETYVPDCEYNKGIYENGEDYIEFLF